MEDRNGHLILCDFGLAIPTIHSPYPAGVGTPGYIAPELLGQGVTIYTHKSDIWSLGVVLLEMHLRLTTSYFVPRPNLTDVEVTHRVQNERIPLEHIQDPLAQDLIYWVGIRRLCDITFAISS